MSGRDGRMDDDEPTLAAASDVVAKIREQAAALRRGSTEARPTQPPAPADPAAASSQRVGDHPLRIVRPVPVVEEPAGSVDDATGEPMQVWQARSEGSLINGAAPPPVTRAFWPQEGPAPESADGDARRLPRRWLWWLPAVLLMVVIVAVSVLVALLLSSGPVTT